MRTESCFWSHILGTGMGAEETAPALGLGQSFCLLGMLHSGKQADRKNGRYLDFGVWKALIEILGMSFIVC